MATKRVKRIRHNDRAESETRLLDAAKEVFSELGYDGATTRLIAARAGINLALIGRYFENKHGLLLAVIERGAAETAGGPLPYPAQKTLLDECLQYAEAKFNATIQSIELFRIVIIQSIVDREFAELMGRTEFLESQEITRRLSDLLKSTDQNGRRTNVKSFLACLERIILGSVVLEYLVMGETSAKCLKDLKTSIRDFAQAFES